MYFYSLLIGSTLILGMQVGFNLRDHKDVISTSNIIIAIAVFVGLVGSIIVRKKENDHQT